jgi:arylsulfatase
MGYSRYFDEASTPGYDTPDLQTQTIMPLRQKGPFVYEENNNVPFVVSSLSTNPDSLASLNVPVISKDVPALASSVDILPTMLGWAGRDASWYEQQFGDLLSGLKMRTTLPGVSLHNVVKDPKAYPEPKWSDGTNGRNWVLFTADSVSSLDADYAYLVLWGRCEEATMNTTKRGILRGCFNGKYKLARYFSPEEYYLNKSQYADLDYEALVASGAHGQDIQLFDLSATPNETFNAAESRSDKVATMNTTLKKAMSKELYSMARTPKTIKNVLKGAIDPCG